MDIDDIKDYAEGYGNYLVDFARSPADALAEVEAAHAREGPRTVGGPRTLDGSLNGTLLTYAAVSFGLSLLVVDASGLADDSSALDAALREADRLPVLLLAGVFVLAALFHGVVKAWIALFKAVDRTAARVLPDPPPLAPEIQLGGSVKATLNAAFAFATFSLPVATLALAAAQGASALAGGAYTTPFAVAVAVIWLALLLGYFPLTLSALHPGTSYWHALMALLIPLMLWRIAAELLGG